MRTAIAHAGRCAELSYRGQRATPELVQIPDARASERYSTVVEECGGSARLLFSRVGYAPPGKNHLAAAWGTLVRAAATQSAYGGAVLTVPHGRHLSHNAAFLCLNGSIVGYGGRDRRVLRHGRRTDEVGIFVFENRNQVSAQGVPQTWTVTRRVVTGDHPGCVERREGLSSTCEFDGRLSAVLLDGAVFLYARANTRPQGGGRYVQVARSSDGREFSRFRPITFACASKATRHGGGRDGMFTFGQWSLHDIYLFVARPARGGGLVGLFPATFATRGNDLPHGGIFVAFSSDGISWSSPVQLSRSRVTADPGLNVMSPQYRTSDYPVSWEATPDGGAAIQVEHSVLLYGGVAADVQKVGATSNGTAGRAAPFHCRYTIPRVPLASEVSSPAAGSASRCLRRQEQLLV